MQVLEVGMIYDVILENNPEEKEKTSLSDYLSDHRILYDVMRGGT